MESEKKHSRGHPAHPPPIGRHNQPVILLITVATLKRRCLLANRETTEILVKSWEQAKHWVVGNYVVMPDHVHLFCAPSQWPIYSVKTWVSYWKRIAGQAEPKLKSAFVWDVWDTQIRNQSHYMRKLEYVAMNPVRRGLVENPDEWPYKGRLHSLEW